MGFCSNFREIGGSEVIYEYFFYVHYGFSAQSVIYTAEIAHFSSVLLHLSPNKLGNQFNNSCSASPRFHHQTHILQICFLDSLRILFHSNHFLMPLEVCFLFFLLLLLDVFDILHSL